MKVIILFLLFLPLNIFGQTKIKGEFCSAPGLIGVCYTFYEDSLYKYRFWNDLPSELDTDSGSYKMTKNSIIFKSVNNDTLKTTFNVEDSNCDMNDSIQLSFIITSNQNNELLPFARILISNSSKNYETTSDENGIACIKLKKSQETYLVNVSFVMFKSCSFTIKADTCMKINVLLASKYNLKENGTIETYNIISLKKNRLVLQEVDSKKKTNFKMILYRRKKITIVNK